MWEKRCRARGLRHTLTAKGFDRFSKNPYVQATLPYRCQFLQLEMRGEVKSDHFASNQHDACTNFLML